MPFGGTEENSGYKGTCLAMFVDIFNSVLDGALHGPYVKKPDRPEPLSRYEPNFSTDLDILSHFTNHIRNVPPANIETNFPETPRKTLQTLVY